MVTSVTHLYETEIEGNLTIEKDLVAYIAYVEENGQKNNKFWEKKRESLKETIPKVFEPQGPVKILQKGKQPQ